MNKAPAKGGKAKPSKDVKGKQPNPADANKQANLIEIVPGKFNENDWNNMLDIDDSQEFIWELIDEVFDSTIKTIHEKYLEKQTIPYTINEARKAILHIIDWQFLSKDVDDDLTEVWIQDEEPEACSIDSWAQGYVQAVQQEDEEEYSKNNQEEDEKTKNSLGFLEELNRIMTHPKMSTEKSSLRKQKSLDSEIKAKIESTKAKAEQIRLKRKQLESISKKKVLVEKPMENSGSLEFNIPEQTKNVTVPREKNFISEIKKLEEPISKAPVACQSLLKTLLTRPLNLREIEIDATGNVQTIAKLDFDKMGTNNIKARFTVVNESKPIHSIDQKNKKNKAQIAPSITIHEEKSRSNIVDDENDIVLEPASGVVFTMLNTTRYGPKRSNGTSKQQMLFEKSENLLRPVKQYDNGNNITRTSIDEILNSTNNIKTPIKLKPIPPINSSTAVN